MITTPNVGPYPKSRTELTATWPPTSDVAREAGHKPQSPLRAILAKQALVSIDQDWTEATRAMIKRKAYSGAAS